jgi:hypothetical protein
MYSIVVVEKVSLFSFFFSFKIHIQDEELGFCIPLYMCRGGGGGRRPIDEFYFYMRRQKLAYFCCESSPAMIMCLHTRQLTPSVLGTARLESIGQGVTESCRLSWLTNSALVYEPKCGWGGGRVAGSQPMSRAVHMEPK